MATGTGLDAQLGLASETTWGTPVTVTRFLEVNSVPMKFNPKFLEPTGLRPGMYFKRASRVQVASSDVTGDVEVEHATKGMGLLWHHALASATTTTTVITGTAYKQIHTPGGYNGLGFTLQAGIPEPSGTVRAHTYAGCKVVGWEFSVKEQAIPTLKLTVDAKSESTATALATASYLSGSTVFSFSQVTNFKLGGTPTTSAGETTIGSGVTIATIVKDFTLTGKTPLATDRYGLGNAGLKAEQIGPNGTPTITGKLTAEYSKAEFYDVYKAGTTVALQLDLQGGIIGATASNYLLSIILPAIKFKSAPPMVNGPEIVQMAVDFEAYTNEVDPVIQVKIQSDEATVV
jgi:hypothetical protein